MSSRDALTESIGDALSAVTLNFDSWDDARLIAAAVEVHARSSDIDAMPGQADLAETFSFQQRFGEAYERLRTEEPERIEVLRTNVERYVAGLVSGWGVAAWAYALVLGPATGWAALLFHERTESLEQEVRAYAKLRAVPEHALRDLRDDIATETQLLLEQGREGKS